jgi:hypothetical protein
VSGTTIVTERTARKATPQLRQSTNRSIRARLPCETRNGAPLSICTTTAS